MTWTGRQTITRLAVAGVTLAALVAAAPAVSAGTVGGRSAALGGPVAVTADGAVRGLASGAVDEFLGIPYAAPPVGALRWQPPQPAASWPGVRAATAFAPHCPQTASPFGQASMSENCLYLNVFTPSHDQPGPGHPVMVWIHGGALVTGESDDYNPARLVADGVTVVTINYRLGALGFLAHPALADAKGQSGDYGLMDQQAALRWVQRNIARFGGDPHDVTLFGESAGGLSTLSQVASPQARGLFQKADGGERVLRPDPGAAARRRGGGRGIRDQGRMRQPDRGLPARPAGLDHPGRRGRGRLHAESQQRGAAAVARHRLRHRRLQPRPDRQRHQPR